MANNKADYTKLSDNFKSYLYNLNKKEEEKKLSSSSENAPKIPDGVGANFRKYLEDMQSGKTAQAETPKITAIERHDLITGKKMPSTFDVAKNAGRIPAISDENAMWNKFAAPKLEENAKKDAETYMKTGSVTKRRGMPEEYPLTVEQNVKKLAARDFVNAVQNAKDSQKPANISGEAAKYNEKNAAKNAAEQVIYERKMDSAAAIENAARLENEAAQKLQEADKKVSDINNELKVLYAQRERYNESLNNLDPYNPDLAEEIAQTERGLEQAQAVKKYWENTSKRRENAFRISYDASVRNAKNNPDKTGYTPTKSGKEIVDLVNGNKKAGTYFGTYAPQEGEFELLRDIGFGKNSSYNNYDYVPQMTSDEVKAYNYVYNMEGADKANAYLEAIKPILTARYRKSVQKDMSEFATEHPAGASAVSLATNFIGGIDSSRATLGYLFNKATGKYVPLDQNDPKYAMSYATSDIRGTVADNMAQKGSFGEVGSFLYQTGMSMLDNVINTALTGGYGEALAGQSTSLTKNLSLALMGSQAAANGLVSAKDRGLSDAQAFALGTISGAAEIITEKIPLDKLLDKLPAGKTAVAKYIGENILSEGLEEASSDVINFVADIAISKDKSEWNTAVNKYMTEDKLTKSEAVKKAFLDQVTAIGLDALGGAISGGTMSAFMSLANRIANRNYYTHLKIGEKDAAVNSALYVDYGSENGISLDNATKFTVDVADALGIKNPEKAFRAAVDYTREEIISLTKDSELVRKDTFMDGNEKTDIGINLDSETDYVKTVNDFIRNNQNDIKKRLSEIYAERNPEKAAKTAAKTETTQNTAEITEADNTKINNSALTENRAGATINAENTQSDETKTAPANKSLAYTALSNKLGITNDVTTEKMTDALFERFGDVRSAVDFVFDTFKELDRNGDLDGESRKFFADLDKNIRNTAERVNQAQMNSLKRAAQTFGANVAWDNANNLSILAKDEESGGRRYSFARFDKSTNTIYLSPYASRQAVIGGKFIHEFTHFAGKYDGSVVSDILSAMNRAVDAGKISSAAVNKINSFVSENYQSEISAYLNSEEGKARISEITSEQNTDERTAADIAAKEYADEERAAYFMETLMQDDSVLRYLADDKKGRNILINIFEKIKSFIKKLLNLGRRDEAVAYAEAGNKIRAILNEKLDAELKMKRADFTKAQSEIIADNAKIGNTADGRRFSMELNVDESNGLFAIHNLTADNFMKSYKLGGFAMPSIAIARGDVGHSNFGDISLVFDSDTIDPEMSRANKVYSADAWTPTFPRTEYEANSKVADKLRDKYYELYRKFGQEKVFALYPYGNYFEEQLNTDSGVDGIISKQSDNPKMMQVYLADTQGKTVDTLTKETKTTLPAEQVEQSEFIIDKLGTDTVNEMRPQNNESPISARKRWMSEHGDAFKAAYTDYLTQSGLTEEEAQNAIDNMTIAQLSSQVVKARNYLANGAETVKSEVDTEATNNAIKEAVNQEDYLKWLHSLFDGGEKKSGIPNGKDRYTRSGDSRPFSATHYPVTLDNIVLSMKSQGDGNTKNAASTFAGSKTIRAESATEYRNLDEIRADKGRLAHRTPEEAKAAWDEFDNRLSVIINRIMNAESGIDNRFIEQDRIGSVLAEASRNNTETNIKKVLTQYKLTPTVAAEFKALVDDIKSAPVDIFEAKPERVVALDEVKYAIVPSDINSDVTTALNNAGIKTKTYENGNEADRLKVLNTLSDVRFSKDISKYDYSKSFSEQIEDYKNGSFPRNDTLIVRDTPKVFRDVGFNSLPMTYTQNHLKDALANVDGDHLGEMNLKQLPSALENPIAIIDSSSKPGRIVAIVEMPGKTGSTIAAIEVDGTGIMRGQKIDSNAIVSAYTKKNAISKLLNDAINSEAKGNNAIYYIHKNKAMQLSSAIGVQFPGGFKIVDGYVHSIRDSGSPVNIKIENVTKTKQFKRWFGDWETHPETSSKVVNEDGTPKVVYHGTTAEFNTFERGDIGFHLGTLEQAENRIDGSKDGRIMELYADIRNPLYAAFDFGDWHGKNTAGMLIETEQFEDFDNRESIEKRLQEISNMSDSSEADNALRSFLKKLGYDGIVYENGFEASGESYIAFDPEQIKSVDNLGTFDKSNGNIRFSKEINTDGIEVYTSSEETKKLSYKERMEKFKDLMENEYSGRTAKFKGENGTVYYALFDSKDVSKNIYGDTKSDRLGREAKIKLGADGDIFDLTENSVYDYTSKESGKKTPAHKNVKSWDYFVKKVIVDNVPFDVLVNVRKTDNGEYVYNIRLTEDKKNKTAPLLDGTESVWEGTKSNTDRMLTVSFDNSIANKSDSVNTFDKNNSDNFSKDFMTEEQRRELKDADRRKYLERQLVQTDPLGRNARAVAPTVVSRIAKDIAENMPGVTTSQVYEKLKGVFDVIEHPKSATVSEFNEEIRSAAEKAATELYNSWKVDNTNPLYDEYSGIYKEIATTPIFVSDEVKKDFDNYGDFYRENFGKLKFRSDKNSAQGVDSVYARLYGQSAVLFGDDNGEMIDNPADQLRKIAEVRNSLTKTPGHPASNPNSMIDTKKESGIISDLTNTILASYIDNSKLTVAARNKALETKNKALEKQVGEAKAKELEAAKTLNYLKRWQDAELNKTRSDFGKNIKDLQRELSLSERTINLLLDDMSMKSRTKLRYTTLQKINRLLNLATNPTKTKYMPESYRKTVLEFLGAVGDLTLPNGKKVNAAERAKLENIVNKTNELLLEVDADSQNGEGVTSAQKNRTEIIKDNLNNIKKYTKLTADIVKQNELREAENFKNLNTSENLNSSEDFKAIEEEYDRKVKSAVSKEKNALNLNRTQYTEYLRSVNQLVSTLMYDINYQNKLFIGEKIESAEETQRKLINDLSLKSSKFVPTGVKESFVKLREALNYYKYNFCSPSVFFSLIGDSGTEIEKAYREAQTKQTDKLKTYSDFMKEAVKDYDINYGAADNKKNVIGIELQGKKFDVTRNQLMSLYLLWNRPQGRQHLETGGAAFVNRKGENNIVQTLRLDEQTFDSLMKHLSKKDIEVAKKVGDFLSSEVSEWGNEASMKLYGVRLFNEENYFPISSTNDSLTTNFTNVDNYRTIQNLGITKAVNPNAKNAIKIMDMFDVADTHIQQMSAYSSYAPLNDSMERLINMPNTKAAIKNYMGKEGEKYLYNFLKTVNLNGARDGKWDPVIDKFSGLYKKAAVSFNLSTAAKQPLSIFRAAIIIDPKYLVKAKANLVGAGSNYKNSLAEMLNNSGIAKIKEQGYSDIGNPMGLRDTYFDETLKNTNTEKVKYGIDKINEIGMKLAGKADQVTWVRIWEACKLQVQAEAKNTLTQSELLKKTSELFGEVIGKTQVVDSFLDSAPISNSAVFRLVAPFMNEPLKTTSTYILAHENLIDAKGSGDKAAISKAKNYALRTAAAAVASNLILEPLISSVFSILRDGEDDDLKSFFDKLLENYFGIQTTTDENGNETISVTSKSILTSNFVDGMTSIPIISQIFDTFQNEAQNFDTTIGPIDLVKDTYKSITKFFEALSNPDSYNQTKTDFALGLDFAANVARLFGIPATSWNRDIRLILQNGARTIPSDLARWNFNKVYYNVANSNARANKNFYDILESAYSKGDKASYYAMLKELKTIQTGEKSYGVKWNVMQNQIEKRGGKIEVGSPMWCVSVQAEFNLSSFNMKMKTESILANVYKDLESAGYDKTECEKVIYKSPTSAPTVTIDGEEKTMTASQYAVYIERVGYAAYDLIQALASTSYWNNLNADQQQYAIEKAYSYVKEYFKKQTFDDYEISTKWMSELAAKRAGDQSIAKEIVSRAKTYKKQNSKITH